ncbi:MAG: hypothetical protein GY790_08115 [Bacteroidetes bacterium]|nr:hypothetical protein [Bacteroidota bacterium]
MNNDRDLVFIASAMTENQAFEISLYANDTLFEGYNPLYISVKNNSSKSLVTDATLALKPIMDMIDMKHAAPCENPIGLANDEDLFEAAVVFIMPSSGMMGWTLDINVKTAEKDETAVLEIPRVKSLDEARKFNVISPLDETKYFVSLVEPLEPEVGINSCEFTVHYKANMMSFPAAEDLTIEIEPEMPSMDHGSPNNENPVHTADGHYVGKVNFTMTGWWRIHMVIKKDGEVLTEEAYMDITLE